MPRGNSLPRKSCSLEAKVEWATCCPSSVPYLLSICFILTSTKRSAKLRYYKKRWCYQYQPHSSNNRVPSDMLCRYPSSFYHKRYQQLAYSPETSCRFLLTLACIAVFILPATHLTTYPNFFYHPPLLCAHEQTQPSQQCILRAKAPRAYIVLTVGPDPCFLPQLPAWHVTGPWYTQIPAAGLQNWAFTYH